MKKILFVEDSTRELRSLQRRLRKAGVEWKSCFAAGIPAAFERLGRERFDVLVASVAEPESDEISSFLRRAGELYPHMVRIVSGQLDHAVVLESKGLVHQFLAKPFDPQALRAAVDRACAAGSLLQDESLAKIVLETGSLPSLPSLYAEVLREADSPECSLDRIGEIISRDVGMSAKILQLANSAFFGYQRRITSIVKAVLVLGLETIKALILSAKVFSRFERSDIPGTSIAQLWDHSLATGLMARSLATQEDLPQGTIDEAFMAGLLHDVGKLILMDRLSGKYSEINRMVNESRCSLSEAEREVIGTTHAQVGAYLMTIWGLSEPVVEAIAYHHCPNRCASQGLGVLTAVHLANWLEHGESAGDEGLDREYLERLGVALAQYSGTRAG